MKAKIKFIFVIAVFLITSLEKSNAQVFWLGFQAGPNVSWFSSPKLDNVITSYAPGYQIGFFARYGKSPYYHVGFNWIRAQADIKFIVDENNIFEDRVPFHNFDLTTKIGFETIHKAAFKWRIDGGPFIGGSTLFSSSVFEFEKNDFRNPQFGFQVGTGVDIYNFNIDFTYNYHITQLFKGDEEDLGVDFGSHLQIIMLKLGFHL